jgi:hypothetical protein
MDPSQADELVDPLMGAFPRHHWTDHTVVAYARALEQLPLEHGGHAVNRAVATLDLAPTVRWLLDTAHAEAARTNPPSWPTPPPDPAPDVRARVKALIADARAKLAAPDASR